MLKVCFPLKLFSLCVVQAAEVSNLAHYQVTEDGLDAIFKNVKDKNINKNSIQSSRTEERCKTVQSALEKHICFASLVWF